MSFDSANSSKPTTQHIASVVLCGGRSKRMGRDKGLITDENGMPWAEKIKLAMGGFAQPVFFSVRTEQLPAYLPVFKDVIWVTDAKDPQPDGPLNGILSTAQFVAEKFAQITHLAIAPCDFPLLETEHFQALHSQLHNNAGVCFKKNGTKHAVPAIISVKELINYDLKTGNSMHKMLHHLEINAMDVPPHLDKGLKNHNKPTDI